MYNKVFKSNQINVGIPVQIRAPVTYQNIRKVKAPDPGHVSNMKEDNDGTDKKDEEAKELMEKARQEAESMIKEAELEASRIMEDAQEKAQELMASTEEEARQKGFERGYEEAKSQYEDLLQEAEFIKESASKEYKEVLESIEKDAVNVILDIARKVIGTEITLNKDNLLELVRQAFERCSNKEDIVMKVSSQDYDFVVENKDKILTLVEGIGKLDIVKDASLKVGALILETPYGSVDAGVHTKFKKVEEAFIKVLGKGM